jgi:uncharacterized MAPEG superfamily protein
MPESLATYAPMVWAMGTSGVLLLLQLLVVDIAGIRSGHVPGAPVASDHGVFMFRATRAHANTNESIASFVLLSLFGIFSSGSAPWLNVLAWLYVLCRVVHMICYYADQRVLRSASFAVSLAALLGIFIVGALAWFA